MEFEEEFFGDDEFVDYYCPYIDYAACYSQQCQDCKYKKDKDNKD